MTFWAIEAISGTILAFGFWAICKSVNADWDAKGKHRKDRNA